MLAQQRTRLLVRKRRAPGDQLIQGGAKTVEITRNGWRLPGHKLGCCESRRAAMSLEIGAEQPGEAEVHKPHVDG